MPLFQALSELFNRKAGKFIYTSLSPSQVTNGGPEPRPMLADQDYLRLWLTEMFLSDDRRWCRNVYPVVHSLVKLTFGGQSLELPYVGGPLNIQEINVNNLSRAISLNHQLTTLVPFNGGTVELEAGLLALPGDDVVGGLLKILGDFAGLLIIPQLTAAVQIAQTVASGLEGLANPANGSLHVGLHQTFAAGSGANQLCSGYFAAILAQENQVD